MGTPDPQSSRHPDLAQQQPPRPASVALMTHSGSRERVWVWPGDSMDFNAVFPRAEGVADESTASPSPPPAASPQAAGPPVASPRALGFPDRSPRAQRVARILQPHPPPLPDPRAPAPSAIWGLDGVGGCGSTRGRAAGVGGQAVFTEDEGLMSLSPPPAPEALAPIGLWALYPSVGKAAPLIGQSLQSPRPPAPEPDSTSTALTADALKLLGVGGMLASIGSMPHFRGWRQSVLLDAQGPLPPNSPPSEVSSVEANKNMGISKGSSGGFVTEGPASPQPHPPAQPRQRLSEQLQPTQLKEQSSGQLVHIHPKPPTDDSSRDPSSSIPTTSVADLGVHPPHPPHPPRVSLLPLPHPSDAPPARKATFSITESKAGAAEAAVPTAAAPAPPKKHPLFSSQVWPDTRIVVMWPAL